MVIFIQWVTHTASNPYSQVARQPANHTARQTDSHTASQPYSQPAIQSASHRASQSCLLLTQPSQKNEFQTLRWEGGSPINGSLVKQEGGVNLVDEGGKVLAFFVSIPPLDKKFGCTTPPPPPASDDVPSFIVFMSSPREGFGKNYFFGLKKQKCLKFELGHLKTHGGSQFFKNVWIISYFQT